MPCGAEDLADLAHDAGLVLDGQPEVVAAADLVRRQDAPGGAESGKMFSRLNASGATPSATLTRSATTALAVGIWPAPRP